MANDALDTIQAHDTFDCERKSCLGGTDVAAILGMHPYRTAFDVWLEKTGQAEKWEGNERTDMGTGLEPYIAAKYTKQTGTKLVKGGFIRHPVILHFGGHLDYYAENQPLVVECKLVGVRALSRWSEPGQDQRVPEEYYVQCQWYMMLAKADLCDLVAQREFQRKLAIYRIVRDEDFLYRAMNECDDWWRKHIDGSVPPENPSKEWLAKTYPKPASEEIVPATLPTMEMVARYRDVEKEKERIDSEYEFFRNAIKGAIGKNLGVKGFGFVATWSPVKDSLAPVTDWRKLIRELLGGDVLQKVEAEIERYTTQVVTRKGSRKLDIKWTK